VGRYRIFQQTLSRVVHDNPNVSRSTRERMFAAIRQLDDRPNTLAQALASGHSNAFGVVSFDTTLCGPATILLGIEKAARRAGYAVSIAPELVVRASTAARRI
jgi:DNA-binding LacI/PurR family transcriptional regulator